MIDMGTTGAADNFTISGAIGAPESFTMDPDSGDNWVDTISENAMKWYDYLTRRAQESDTAMVPVASVPGGGTLALSQPTLIALAVVVVAVVLFAKK